MGVNDDENDSVFSSDSAISFELPVHHKLSVRAAAEVSRARDVNKTQKHDIEVEDNIVYNGSYVNYDQYEGEEQEDDYEPDIQFQNRPSTSGAALRKNTQALGLLVKHRLQTESLRTLLNEALESTINGNWAKFVLIEKQNQRNLHRPLDEVLRNCEAAIQNLRESLTGNIPQNLISELAVVPEVYQVILSMIEVPQDMGRAASAPIEKTNALFTLSHDLSALLLH